MDGMAAARTGWSWRQAAAPAAIVVVAAGILASIVVAARGTGGGGAPPTPGPMAVPRGANFAAFNVERVEGTDLAGSGAAGPVRLAVPESAPVWVLERAGEADAAPGMPAAVIGVPNEVRNATIRAIVLGEAGTVEGRVAGPFGGHEALGEPAALPLVTGIIETVEPGRFVLATAGGRAEVWWEEEAPLYVARGRGLDVVGPGDRVAVLLNEAGELDPGRGLLVLPGE